MRNRGEFIALGDWLAKYLDINWNLRTPSCLSVKKKLNRGRKKSVFGVVKLLLCSIYGEHGWGEKVGFPRGWKGCFPITCRHCWSAPLALSLSFYSPTVTSAVCPWQFGPSSMWELGCGVSTLCCCALREALRPGCCVTDEQDKHSALISRLITPRFNQSTRLFLCCHPLNAPFLLELSLVKMSKFSH